MGSKNRKKQKGYVKTKGDFESAASGKTPVGNSSYAKKVIRKIVETRSGADEPTRVKIISLEMTKASGTGYQLPSKRELGAMPERAPVRSEPMDVFTQTKKMVTYAYYGAGRSSIRENHVVKRTGIYGEEIFAPVADKDLQSKPCRLVAECIEEKAPFSRWILSRIVGISGKQVESAEVQASYSDMFSFLKNWQDERPSRDLAGNTPLPENLKAAMVHQLDVHAIKRMDYRLMEEASKVRRLEDEARAQKVWEEYSGILKEGKVLSTDAYSGASQQTVKPSIDVYTQAVSDIFFSPPIFSSDFDHESMPCRLMAECTGNLSTVTSWKLSRLTGANGEHVETKEVISGLSGMARFLMNWNKKANQDFSSTEAALPECVSTVPVSRLDQLFFIMFLTEAREDRLQVGPQRDAPRGLGL